MPRRFGDFEAFPRHYHGRGAGGTPEAPGFHTASRIETTLPYACLKIAHLLPDSWDKYVRRSVRHEGLEDAGVVVEIDMAGFEPYPDIDAEYALSNFTTFLDEFAKEADPDYDLFEQFYEYIEHWGDYEPEYEDTPEDVLDLLFRLTGPSPESLAYSLRGWLETVNVEYANRLLYAAIRGHPDPVMVMYAIGQFRYLLDVPSERIVSVNVLKPWFNHVFPHWEDPDYNAKVVESIEKAGLVTANQEDYFSHDVPYDYALSWNMIEPAPEEPPEKIEGGYETVPWMRKKPTPRSRVRVPWQDIGPYRQLYFEGMEVVPRIEYHGTSLINLCLAAPEFDAIAREIPPPFNPERFYARLKAVRSYAESQREGE